MLKDITIGQFFPGNSLLHKLDPRIKILLTIAYIALVFIPRNWVGLAVTAVFLTVVYALSRLPVMLIVRSIKPIIPVVLLTAGLSALYVQGDGDPLVSWWIIRIYAEGIYNAIFLAIRIVCLIVGSSLLTYTTGPTTLTDALERLMKPLKLIRVPVHELAMMMTIALRFIPTLIEETDKIMSAQKARGADLEGGNLIQRIRALMPIMIPLFVSSFRRAYELATAMECRCYNGGDGRTRMIRLHMAARDWVAMGVMLLLAGGMVALNFVFPVVI